MASKSWQCFEWKREIKHLVAKFAFVTIFFSCFFNFINGIPNESAPKINHLFHNNATTSASQCLWPLLLLLEIMQTNILITIAFICPLSKRRTNKNKNHLITPGTTGQSKCIVGCDNLDTFAGTATSCSSACWKLRMCGSQ